MVHRLVLPNAWLLSPDSLYWRRPMGGFDKHLLKVIDKFDFQTLFYDFFRSSSGTQVFALAPHFNNLLPHIEQAKLYVSDCNDNNKTQCSFNINSDRGGLLDLVVIDIPENFPAEFLYMEAKVGNYKGRISTNENELLKGCNVLVTRNKNNKISWIVDWVNYHVAVHGFNAAVIFDNGSTDYTIFDLYNELVNKTYTDVLIVIQWPFRFGSPILPKVGGDYPVAVVQEIKNRFGVIPPANNFGDFAMATYAYLRFGASCSYWMCTDIDELVVPYCTEETKDALFNEVTSVEPRYLQLERKPMHPLPFRVKGEVSSDYYYAGVVDNNTNILGKYIFSRRVEIPQEYFALRPHRLKGVTSTVSSKFYVAHFSALSTFWYQAQNKRIGKQLSIKNGNHKFAAELFSVFARMSSAFPDYKYPYEAICDQVSKISNKIFTNTV